MKKKREQVEKLMPTYSETKRRFMSLGIWYRVEWYMDIGISDTFCVSIFKTWVVQEE
jgi:hypothetical protein